MEAKEFFEERERMLNSLGRTGGLCSGVFCGDCPLYQGERASCETESAVDIVEAWSAEHPKKTYLDVLLEAFPNTPMSYEVPSDVCPCNIGLATSDEDILEYCNYDNCTGCWNREYKEVDND